MEGGGSESASGDDVNDAYEVDALRIRTRAYFRIQIMVHSTSVQHVQQRMHMHMHMRVL